MNVCPINVNNCDNFAQQHIYELIALLLLSFCGTIVLWKLLKSFSSVFIEAGFSGKDLNKLGKPEVPEAQGVLAGAVFLIIMFLFIPVPFWKYISKNTSLSFNQNVRLQKTNEFSYIPPEQLILNSHFIQYLAGLLSMCCMIFLGFADDSLNLKWRHKLFLPSIASLPLLMVHVVNERTTTIIVPIPLRTILGVFYYIYMGMLAVFCTNAVNIYAGVNGLEAGQSLIIGVSVVIFNVIELQGFAWRAHLFSLYFLIPFVFLCAVILFENWYPARIFVGDTFCYFAGMMFAVVGILGHFSKTLLLFFIPQIINFLLSTPQLFRVFPCPRHRLPRLNSETGMLHPSTVTFHTSSSKFLYLVLLRVFNVLRLSRLLPDLSFSYCSGDRNDKLIKSVDSNVAAGDQQTGVCNSDTIHVELTNLTLINLVLRWFGPCHEARLTVYLLVIQILCTGVAFTIRYPIAHYFYGLQPII